MHQLRHSCGLAEAAGCVVTMCTLITSIPALSPSYYFHLHNSNQDPDSWPAPQPTSDLSKAQIFPWDALNLFSSQDSACQINEIREIIDCRLENEKSVKQKKSYFSSPLVRYLLSTADCKAMLLSPSSSVYDLKTGVWAGGIDACKL